MLAVICAILVFVIGAALLYVQSQADGWLGSEKDCLDEFEESQEAVDKAVSLICETYCPCDYGDYDPIELEAALGGRKPVEGTAENVLECEPCEKYDEFTSGIKGDIEGFIEDQLDIQFEGCDVTSDDVLDDYFSSDQKKFLPMLKWIEKQFNCSGFCSNPNIYLFSELGEGKPDGSCRGEVKDWIEEDFLAIGATLVACAILLFIMPVCSCGVCCNCCKSKKNKENGTSA